jgi:uroporphyrinogen-III synthase
MKILVSQKQPSNLTPYEPLKKKFGAEIESKPFFLIEPLSSREFRAQRINLQDYTAVVFSSRHAIDAYFQLAENLRFKVPDTMKYFCTTELVAMYLQKHIVYRKRKIFYGDGKPESVVALIGPKHKGEKFLITASEGSDVSNLTTLFDKAGLDYTVGTFVKSVPQDLTTVDFASCDVVVLYNKFDINALYASYPDFQQGDLKMIAYGKSIAKAMEEAGLEIAAQGPTPATPSAAKTIETYLDSCAKGKGAAKK